MYLINFSRNCFITKSGLNYPLAQNDSDEGLVEYLLLIPFLNFNYTDFRTDYDGKLYLQSAFKVVVNGNKLSIVKNYDFRPQILLLLSVPYNEEAKFVSLDGEKSPEKIYSFQAGDPRINGLSLEIMMILNIYDNYRFALIRSKRSILFYNLCVTKDFELRLNWENFSR